MHRNYSSAEKDDEVVSTLNKTKGVITHELIFARSHWIKRIMWYKFGGRFSLVQRPPTAKQVEYFTFQTHKWNLGRD